jgi:hypothetical protein
VRFIFMGWSFWLNQSNAKAAKQYVPSILFPDFSGANFFL